MAYFSRKLNKKQKLPIYLPLTDLGLIIQQNKTKPAFIGLWPIRGLFSKKIDKKKSPFIDLGLIFRQKRTKNPFLSAFGRFETHFSSKQNKKLKNPLLSVFGRFGAHFSTEFDKKHKKSLFIGLRPI